MKTYLIKVDLKAVAQQKPLVFLISAKDQLSAIQVALGLELDKDNREIDDRFLVSIEAFIQILTITEVFDVELPILKTALYNCSVNLNLQLNIAA